MLSADVVTVPAIMMDAVGRRTDMLQAGPVSMLHWSDSGHTKLRSSLLVGPTSGSSIIRDWIKADTSRHRIHERNYGLR